MRVIQPSNLEEALGAARLAQLRANGAQLAALGDALRPVVTQSWELLWVDPEVMRGTDEDWVFLKAADGRALFFDEASQVGHERPDLATVYPELHSRLAAWWLTHAWRITELGADASTFILDWRLASGAVVTRALLESVAAMAHEAAAIGRGWASAKAEPNSFNRSLTVRRLVGLPLARAFRGSRLEGVSETLRAPNVLTQLEKLKKLTGEEDVLRWYDILSEASHPSAYSKILYASQLHVHDSRAIARAWYAQMPMVSVSADTRTPSELPQDVALAATAAQEWAHTIVLASRRIVDDFGLTTQAARFTDAEYAGRQFSTAVEGACACGCNGDVSHQWGAPSPEFRLR